MKDEKKIKKVVITSGFFNPVHIGHINLIKESKKLGDYLIVIVNNDKQVKIKGSVEFMPEQERMAIIEAMEFVDEVFLSIDGDGFVAKSLEEIGKRHSGKKLIFAKGGDRNIDNIPSSERDICVEFGIEVVSGVGGDKVQSSSWLLSKLRINDTF